MNHSHGPVRGQVSPALNSLGFHNLSIHHATSWQHTTLPPQSLPRLNTSPPPSSSPLHPPYIPPPNSTPSTSSPHQQLAPAGASITTATNLLSALLAAQPHSQALTQQDAEIIMLLLNRLATVSSQLAAAQQEQLDSSKKAELVAMMAKLGLLPAQSPAAAELANLQAQLQAQAAQQAVATLQLELQQLELLAVSLQQAAVAAATATVQQDSSPPTSSPPASTYNNWQHQETAHSHDSSSTSSSSSPQHEAQQPQHPLQAAVGQMVKNGSFCRSVSFLNLGLQLLPQHLVEEAINDLEANQGQSSQGGNQGQSNPASTPSTSARPSMDGSNVQQMLDLDQMLHHLKASEPAAAVASPTSAAGSAAQTPMAATTGPSSIADSFSSLPYSPYSKAERSDAFAWTQETAAEAAATASLMEQLQAQSPAHRFGGVHDGFGAGGQGRASMDWGAGGSQAAAVAAAMMNGGRRSSSDATMAAALAAAAAAGPCHASMDLAAQALLSAAGSRRGSMDGPYQLSAAMSMHPAAMNLSVQSALLADQLAVHRGSLDMARSTPAAAAAAAAALFTKNNRGGSSRRNSFELGSLGGAASGWQLNAQLASQARSRLSLDLPHGGAAAHDQQARWHQAHHPQPHHKVAKPAKDESWKGADVADQSYSCPLLDDNDSWAQQPPAAGDSKSTAAARRQSREGCGRRHKLGSDDDGWYLSPPATCRLFVGNIGWWVDEQLLAKWFGEFGEVVDIQVMWNTKMLARGRRVNREFAFISFRSQLQAARALHWMHGCQIEALQKDRNGLTVEYEASAADAPAAAPPAAVKPAAAAAAAVECGGARQQVVGA